VSIVPARWTRTEEMRVSSILKVNGWERYQKRFEDGRREWRYRRV
jgi:putative DNA primase/helicase